MSHFVDTVSNGNPAFDIPPLATVDCKVGASMWLWRLHNAVNARTRHDPFPNAKECPDCASNDNIRSLLSRVYGKPAFTQTDTELAGVSVAAASGGIVVVIAHAAVAAKGILGGA